MDTRRSGTSTRLTTGAEGLDGLLDGGYPERRGVVLSGGPGTGKSILAMAFLQAGIADGDRALYVTTEQTAAELRDSFDGLPFDLDAPELAVASFEETVGAFVGGDSSSGRESLEQLLTGYAPRDRVAFDGVTGYAASVRDDAVVGDLSEFDGDGAAGPAAAPRRIARDVIRTVADDLEATPLLVAESNGDASVARDAAADATDAGRWAHAGAPATDGLEHVAHVAVQLRQGTVDGDPHRFLRITKARGLDHDPRTVELTVGEDGAAVVPHRRSLPDGLVDVGTAAVGIPGIDTLTGGGLVRGAGVLLQHDGRVPLGPLMGTVLAGAFQRDHVVELIPSIHLRAERLRTLLGAYGHDVEQLLASDRLFVFDMGGTWETGQHNVFDAREELPEVRSTIAGIADRTDGSHFRVVDADAMVHALGATDARALRNAQETTLLRPDDQLLHLQHPGACGDREVALYEDAATQILRLHRTEGSNPYLTLEKSPFGAVGASCPVSFLDEPPYVDVEAPSWAE